MQYGRRLRQGAKCLFLSEPDPLPQDYIRGHRITEGRPNNIVTAKRCFYFAPPTTQTRRWITICDAENNLQPVFIRTYIGGYQARRCVPVSFSNSSARRNFNIKKISHLFFRGRSARYSTFHHYPNRRDATFVFFALRNNNLRRGSERIKNLSESPAWIQL